MLKPYLFLLIAVTSILNKPFAQTAVADTAFYRSAIDNIIRLYTDSVGENLRLYSGTEFTGGYRSSAGHPFFEYAEPQLGTVFYNGIRYPDVRLEYDLIRDELIFVNPANNLNIKLITQKVEGFSIQNRLFIHITEGNSMANFPGAGFYELLYDKGAIQVLAKRRKRLRQAAKAEELAKFTQTNNYYIKKDSTYYTIDSKKSLITVFKDHKAEVTKFIQKENLNFKKDPERTIVKVVDYYTQFKN